VAHDDAQAAEWYRMAADQGFGRAQNNLGALYEHGVGVAQDLAAAARWYRKAALQGHADAEYNLGRLYADGSGVPRSYADAWYWLNLSARGSAGAHHERAVNALSNVEKLLTPAELELVRERVRQLAAVQP